MKQLLGTLAVGTAALLLTGCYYSKTGPKFDARLPKGNVTALTNLTSVAETNRIADSWLKPSSEPFRLGPGDRVEIEIIGDAASRAITTIGPDGKIYYYLLPGVDVWGLTLPELKAKMETELGTVLNAPQVSVMLRGIDSQRVWLLGRVQNAGVYPMPAPMTLLEALSMAGGASTSSASGTTEDLADLQHSFVIRNGQRLPIDFAGLLARGDMKQNIYLQPDDFVYLPSSLSRDIYVLGAVRAPKAVARHQNTLVAAIADSGGPVRNAYLSHVAIVRGSLSDPKIAVVDFNEIVKGKAPDVLLEPRDIVYIPYSPYRYLTKYADLILTTFVRAVAINEGARAAEPSAAATGVSIGITPTLSPITPVIVR